MMYEYIFVVLIFDTLALGNAYNQYNTLEIVVPNAPIDLTKFRLKQRASYPACS